MSALTNVREPVIALASHGLVDYQKAWDVQRTIHQEVAEKMRPNTLMLLQHPSVYTAGRRSVPSEHPQDGTPVIDVDRGGRITWHGPGQLVGYPIIRLAKPTELVGFVREIEAALIAVCAEFGIQAQCVSGRSGVWICDEKGERKIAAIGIRVSKGVSMHGFALNICPDLTAFEKIVPCGIEDADVTSMAKELSREITIEEVTPIVERYIFESLSRLSQ